MNYFWETLDHLVSTSKLKIDRPKGSTHPRFPQYVYPVDYGYLDGTTGGDGEGIDVWRGNRQSAGVIGVICTVDPHKRNAELKLLLSCTDDEIAEIEAFYQPQAQASLLQLRNRAELAFQVAPDSRELSGWKRLVGDQAGWGITAAHISPGPHLVEQATGHFSWPKIAPTTSTAASPRRAMWWIPVVFGVRCRPNTERAILHS